MGRPNILLIVSDQERQRGWIPGGLTLPNRQRLIDSGLEFTRHHTVSSPCSPSRASLFTGRYVPQHGVNENVLFPSHRELSPDVPTLGHLLRDAGYRTAYLGKWHLSHAERPDMEAYGFGDWSGNDRHYMGFAGTGAYFDPIVAERAACWLRDEGAGETRPWFLAVALVNPHDIHWYPIDQPDYQEANAEELATVRGILPVWHEGGDPVPPYVREYDEVFDALPANFDDDLWTKPAVQRQWIREQNSFWFGRIDPADERGWLRQLDYYWRLHQDGDVNLGLVLDALEASGRAADTVVIFTSDHGDMCGSHGLRSKGPFVYDEIMRIPLYVRVPGVTAGGSRTDALSSSVDVARTICALAGAAQDSCAGVDLTPVLRDPSARVREHVLFAHDMAYYGSCLTLRYAVRGIFDGRHKYARYYGVGGGTDQFGRPSKGPKLFGADAAAEDCDHELYDTWEDPHELVNLAMDRGRRAEVREWFGRLRAIEAEEYA
ncbi:sulfatase-like hydrolase/transferase [Bailinhaonella thermotolerans]|uniref:Sulfatase N-terminal domain-containing protein n=1 Tax=Bailinhaonella thermotolerans TaxID=1070861 RepID=A0A3A4B6H5_9ACTN|nr:sulfatase-like hydrolase/transferase [Bailinhaonella thermotolerans]RJL34167.1 hypothetical protein D5H75_06730 [Bailinhaonella thermotolerans]